MNKKVFITIHTIAFLAFLLTTQIAGSLQANPPPDLAALLGMALISISLVLSLELFILGLSFAIPPLAGRAVRAAWGFSLLPIALLLIADFRLLKSWQSHLNFRITYYSVTNISDLLPIISSEITDLMWPAIVAAMFLCLILSIAGWRTPQSQARPLYTMPATLPPLFLLLLIATTDSCLNTSLNHPFSSQNNILLSTVTATINKLAGKSCSTTTETKTIPDISKIKLAQLTQNQTNNNKASPPTERLPTQSVQLKTTSASKLGNVVVIIMESTRADALTPFNPRLDTTPFLNTIADEGIIAKNSFVNYAYTSKSLVSISCGIPPNPRVHITESNPGGIPTTCLPSLLRPLGYKSAFFQTATEHFENRRTLVNNIGFDYFSPLQELDSSGWETVNYFGIEERAMIKPIMKWVDSQEGPFLLSALTLTSHHPYQPPPSYPQKKYEGSELWSSYLNTVRYTDSFLQELFTEFDKRNLLDNTLFVFTSDHGTSLQGNSDLRPFRENIHIPIIFWNKQLIPKPLVVNDLKQHTDIIPTIADLMNLEVAQGNFYGTSLLKPAPEDRTIYATCKMNNCSGRLDNLFMFFQYYNQNPSELFDLTEDPHNNYNLIQALSKNLVENYTNKLQDYQKQVIKFYEAPDHLARQEGSVQGTKSPATFSQDSLVETSTVNPLRQNRNYQIKLYFEDETPNTTDWENTVSLTLNDWQGHRSPLTVKSTSKQKQTDPYTQKPLLTLIVDFKVPPHNIPPGEGFIELTITSDQTSSKISLPVWIMDLATKNLDFEKAAQLRDTISGLSP